MKLKRTLVVVVGETGSGKSQAALVLAKALNGEIINADSWAVYKGFDIGTAKPTAEEQAQVRHHLLDVADPLEGFSAVLYKQLANQAIEDIKSRGKLPIIAGGTGLYVDSVLYNYQFLPAVSAEERAVRNQRSIEELLAEAQAAAISLEDIDIRNKRRIIRALEAGGQRPTRSAMRTDAVIFGIATDREKLLKRVTARVNFMLERGLEQEVADLVSQYGWGIEPMKGIGYAEWREYFEGSQSLEKTKQQIIRATMNLAKRQRTWFKRNPHIHWIADVSEASRFIEPIAKVTSAL